MLCRRAVRSNRAGAPRHSEAATTAVVGMIETHPKNVVAEGGDLGGREGVQDLNPAAVSARGYSTN